MSHLTAPKVYLPLLLILVCEILFRFGLWENMAAPASHTGKSIRAREAILQQPDIVNFITIGNSIPESGLNHKNIYELGKEYGFTHVNFCMPGSHLLTTRKLAQWLPEHIPNLYGVIIGLSFRDLFFSFNGYYELKIITPFIKVGDEYWMSKQAPFQPHKLESYGIFSNLIASREDIRDFLSDPIKRYHDLTVEETKNFITLTKPVINSDESICSIDTSSYDNCMESISLINKKNETRANLDTVKSQCIKFMGQPDAWSNIETILHEPLSQERLTVKENWQKTLKKSKLKLPPIFILMPTSRSLTSSKADQATYKWAIDILKQLDKSEDIILEDLTFLLQDSNECEYFRDLVHLNLKGQNKVMETITPRLKIYYNQMQKNLASK